ncbi:hypothetical protein CBR_g30065 [Chara braunii]|uniref:ABC transporter domain-containing protein n=1 Tax=Chara braunii TaxID=69332 RepID=A0A388LC91_CHABU|nr:hypothetical protein CBR_g30065 [Chara braunii]|eukprot:GBG79802.1 hypothetical protein CBR_g30065 [Chara braunii]
MGEWMGGRERDGEGVKKTVVIFIASIGAVASKGVLSPVLVGLSLAYGSQLSGLFQWTVRQFTEVENVFVSVERCLEYTDLPQEGGLLIIQRQPEPSWPKQGSIRLENLKVRYHADMEPVLKGISFLIEGGEKCGIVGRTGAGKSTLMLALFRLVDATEGHIFFDDVNIAEIGLENLRRKISAIPQDPVLFGSTVRFNLDPFSEHSEQELWDALQAVQLKDKVMKLQGTLNASMAEFGDNFSVGERQMCCLARAILQKSKILIMDEATANVDLETDAQIQTTLRERFVNSTVLIIAHRMDTIIDVDKIALLDHGKLEEFGPPEELLDKEEGMFRGMVKRVGAAGEAQLRQTAKQSAEERETRRRRMEGK